MLFALFPENPIGLGIDPRLYGFRDIPNVFSPTGSRLRQAGMFFVLHRI
jgi:hypothetical protein